MILNEVELGVNVFGLIIHHGIPRICDGALTVFPDGCCLCDLGVKDFADELAEVNDFPRCVSRGIVLTSQVESATHDYRRLR
jgi:hypothetical protein